MLPSCTEAEGFAAWMSVHVLFVPENDPFVTLIVAGVFGVKVMRPEAMAVLTLPSFQVLLVMTCWFGILNFAEVGTSPFLKASPTVNGRVPPSGDVSWNEVTVLPGGGGGGGALETVTLMAALVAGLPATSFAVAASV